MKFGDRLRKYREENNLTQSQLSEKLGISRTHLAMIETSKRPVSAELRKKIAKETEKPLKWWITNTEYDEDSYEEMYALSMLIDFMIDKGMIITPDDIEKEIDYIKKILKEEVRIKLAKVKKLNNE